ncbi:MAG: ABC transporter ATP-binding protein [Armatimonadota bacterium]
MAGEPVVQISDVDFSYDGLQVLEDVEVTVEEGDFIAVVGPNGGGKTTLVRLILGLLEPDTGEVRLFGRHPEYTRRQVGYVPQDFRFNPNFPVTVMDVVLMGQLGTCHCFGPYSKSDREAAKRALRRVDLEGMGGRLAGALSGGQLQRVLIARAIISDPTMLILDEPTASLDAPAEADIYNLLKRLNDHMTIMVVTHDFGFVSRFVNSVLCVHGVVRRHPTSEFEDVSGELLQRLYGTGMQLVRHDHHIGEPRAGEDKEA